MYKIFTFLCKYLLLFYYANMASGNVSEHTLLGQCVGQTILYGKGGHIAVTARY